MTEVPGGNGLVDVDCDWGEVKGKVSGCDWPVVQRILRDSWTPSD